MTQSNSTERCGSEPATAGTPLTRDEKSLLLFFESRATDYGGTLESPRMNAVDFAIAKRWNETGFVCFGRIAYHDIKKNSGVPTDHWCVLSDEAWRIAHAERRARADRMMSKLSVKRLGAQSGKCRMLK